MTLPDDVAEALSRVAAVRRLLVATDFDGVLAPIVLDPSTSRPLPGTVESLTGLAELPGTAVAVVSGRDLATLGSLTGLEGSAVTLIGSHGAETSAASGAGLTEAERALLDEVVAELEALTVTGIRVETKPQAVVAHSRGLEPEAAVEADEAVLEVAGRHPELSVLRGKSVVELSLHDADKGTALADLRKEVGADALVYFGDDVTDEHVFTRMGDGDVGVKVGDGDTAARWRVEDPQDAAEALAVLLEHRRSTT